MRARFATVFLGVLIGLGLRYFFGHHPARKLDPAGSRNELINPRETAGPAAGLLNVPQPQERSTTPDQPTGFDSSTE